MWFWDGINRHGVHAVKYISAERLREITLFLLFSALFTNETNSFIVRWHGARFIVSPGKSFRESIGPRPETFSKSIAHGFDE